TALADIFMRHADAATAAGREVTPHALAGNALAGGRIFPRDLRPVAFQLLGDELGEAGERPLTHLGTRDADHDGVVRADHHPGVDFRRAVRGADDPRAAERDVEPERKPATRGGGAYDEAAAIHFGHVIHGRLPLTRSPRRRESPRAPAGRCRNGRYW